MISLILSIYTLAFSLGDHVWNFDSETIGQYKIQDAIFAEVFFETIKIAIKRPIPSGFQFARTAPN